MIALVALSLLVAVLIGFGVLNLIGLHIWLRLIKKMTTYEYIISQRKSAKYRDPASESKRISDTERLDNSSQMPLVHKGFIRHSNSVVPDISLRISASKLPGKQDEHKVTVSPNTELSAYETKKEPEELVVD
jgi:hypothetical protein